MCIPLTWHSALAQAITGESFDFPDTTAADLEALIAALATCGWDETRIREGARAAVQSEQIWPYPLPADAVSEIGAAAFSAALIQLRMLLGCWVLDVKPPVRGAEIGEAELRLLQDVPPHYGS